ncbi:MAG: Gfo/Idh/MocA family oxidoreductase [Bacillota bacterium]|nr:Gfo/Idh/MocA family oxidoreductase [Bacillota bacterium]
MDVITCIIVGAGGRGKEAYAPFIAKRKDMRIVGVAEPDELKRNNFKELYQISDDMCFSDYRELFKRDRLADCVLICTMDKMHLEPTLMAMEKKYHILLEKPIAATPEDVAILDKAAKSYDRVFMTGFVLRYAKVFKTLKKYIEEGKIGKIISIQHNENEGYWHHAHSYVRGQWNNTHVSPPLILAKSCHDLDLLLYLTGKDCINISSYGKGSYFSADNAPAGAPLRCHEGCPYENSCKYNAKALYTTGKGKYFIAKFECGDDEEKIREYLKTSPYGRCVYHCDNNMCDHQVTSMEFEDGITAVFTVCAFTLENSRTIKIMGTEGELGGSLEKEEILYSNFNTDKVEKIKLKDDGLRHGGGDKGIIDYLAESIKSGNYKYDSFIGQSHMMAFAAEESRLTGKKIDINEFKCRYM